MEDHHDKSEKYINFFTDYGFKHLFGEESNKDLLQDFLNAVLSEEEGEIKTIKFLKNEQLGRSETDRKAVYDIYCENEKGERFIVELQKTRQDFFKDRTVYYSTFPIRDQAVKGSSWNFELKAVYCIGILDFIFKDNKKYDSKYISRVKLTDIETCEVFYDKLYFIFLEMPKFKKTRHELSNRFEKWLYVIQNLHLLDAFPEELQEEVFSRIFQLAELSKLSRQEYENYEQSLKSYRDLKNVLDTARKEGHEKGRLEESEAYKIEKAKLLAEKQAAIEREKQAQAEKQAEAKAREKAEAEKQQAEVEKQKAEAEKQAALEREQAEAKAREQAEVEKQQAETEKQQTELKMKAFKLFYGEQKTKAEIANILQVSLEWVDEALL